MVLITAVVQLELDSVSLSVHKLKNLYKELAVKDCDSGVDNVLFEEDGCTMNDLIADCAEGALNQRKFVSCIDKLTRGWKKDGCITGKQKDAIKKCATKSTAP